MSAEAPLKIFREPSLKNPRLVVAWGCIGEVGIGVVTYLRDKLGAEEFGEIEFCDFFNIPVEVRNGLVEELEFPRSKLYYWENREGKDLILCIADQEPPLWRYEYANLLLDVAEQFQVERIYTACAFPSLITHSAEPRVFGLVNDTKLVKYLEQYHITVIKERKLTSMNALLLGLARKRGLQGIYLLGEVPSYSTQMANPKSCRAVLKVLTAMLGVDIDIAEFDRWIEQSEEEMNKMVKDASRAFLEDFTIDYRDLFQREDYQGQSE